MNAARSSTATGTTATAEARPRGRFAPSPSGRLHQGSLCTAVGSWLDARAAGGEWLVRIEDLDAGRSRQSHADHILRTLEACALTWDGPVVYQSRRGADYAAALTALARGATLYPCTCSRRDLPAAPEDGEARYPGTCRDGPRAPARDPALRIAWPPAVVTVEDRLQGTLAEDVAAVAGDIVLRRRDGGYAYALAVVVDDAAQGITDVVRGADLWPQTPRQCLLQHLLGLPRPRYLHLPLVVEPDGRKLAKSRRSAAPDPAQAAGELPAILAALGLPPPAALTGAPAAELLQWGVQHWCADRVRPAAIPAWR